MNKFITYISFISLFISLLIASVLIGLGLSMKPKLTALAQEMEFLANDTIFTTVYVEQMVDFESDVMIQNPLLVQAKMQLNDSIPFRAAIPVQEKLVIPIQLDIQQTIGLNGKVRIPDTLSIHLGKPIVLDQQVELSLNKKSALPVPIKADILLKNDLKGIIPDSILVIGNIPVSMPLRDSLPVWLNLEIPVELMVPINLNISEKVWVKTENSVKIKGSIPLKMAIPVAIPLKQTNLHERFLRMGKLLGNLLGI